MRTIPTPHFNKNIRHRTITHTLLQRLGIILLLVGYVGVSCPVVFAAPTGDTPEQLYEIQTGTGHYDPYATCNGTSTAVSPVGTGTVQGTADQDAIAKIIMGIAKTDDLGETGAEIGLMVGLDESTLTDLANSNVPLSLESPGKQGIGANGTSLGVFQQQITDAWSTISSDPNNQAAVDQLMTPAYDAEAFFGSPPNSKAAGALSKGLQNITGWQNMEPWVAAQAVQLSGDPTGANYEAQLGAAQALLNQFWATAPAVALPVPLIGSTGGSVTGNAACNGATTTDCSGQTVDIPVSTEGLDPTRLKILQTAFCQLSIWDSKPDYGDPNFPYAHTGFLPYSQGRYEEWCADFASWVYNEAGDPLAKPDWNIPSVSAIAAVGQNGLGINLVGKFTYHSELSGYKPTQGDLAIHGGFHVNIYIGIKGGDPTYIGGDQGNNGGYGTFNPPSNSIVSYEIATPGNYYDNGITGYLSPN